jgi:copper chaperone CopZ
MKTILICLTAFLSVNLVAVAEVTTKISEVHLCCKSCVTGVEKAVATVPDAKAEADQNDGTVIISGPDAATVQKAADALTRAGYFGKSGNSAITMNAKCGAKGEKVQTLRVEGVHLCCGKCVKAVDHALKSVPGVKENTAAKGVKSFEVTGDFNDQEVFTALQKEGLTGHAGK